MKFKSNDIIRETTANMNKTKSTKYQIEPEEIERKSLENNEFREKFDFYRIQKINKHHKTSERYFEKKTNE